MIAKVFAGTAAGILSAAMLLATPAFAQSDFYNPPAGEIAGTAGSIIRMEPMRDSWFGARTVRVLYRSTGLKGEPIAVSGAVIVPAGPPPPDGWSIVAWEHPTTGMVPRCAPTLAIFFFHRPVCILKTRVPANFRPQCRAGADTIAGRWAKFYGVPVTVFEADWKAKGKRAGPLRNIKMLDEFKPDVVCAVIGHEGTWHCLLEAQKRNIPIRLG